MCAQMLLDRESLTMEHHNPFPGLRAFNKNESHLFFGRERQTQDLFEKLRIGRFVAVLGASGSGKSSLIRCGLVPEMERRAKQRGTSLHVATFRPGNQPINNLILSLAKGDIISRDKYKNQDHEEQIANALKDGAKELDGDSYGLVNLYKNSDLYSPNKNEREILLIFIDQFEEIFTQNEDSDEARHLINLLVTATDDPEINEIYVALCMREDFTEKARDIPKLLTAMEKNPFYVKAMSQEERNHAIEGPILEVIRRQFDLNLFDFKNNGVDSSNNKELYQKIVTLRKAIVDDLDQANEQLQLPILQHTLMRTWDVWIKSHDFEVWKKDGKPERFISEKHYNQIERLNGAVEQHIQETYNDLPPAYIELKTSDDSLLTDRPKRVTRVIFQAITRKNKDDDFGVSIPRSLKVLTELADEAEREALILHYLHQIYVLLPAYQFLANEVTLEELEVEKEESTTTQVLKGPKWLRPDTRGLKYALGERDLSKAYLDTLKLCKNHQKEFVAAREILADYQDPNTKEDQYTGIKSRAIEKIFSIDNSQHLVGSVIKFLEQLKDVSKANLNGKINEWIVLAEKELEGYKFRFFEEARQRVEETAILNLSQNPKLSGNANLAKFIVRFVISIREKRYKDLEVFLNQEKTGELFGRRDQKAFFEALEDLLIDYKLRLKYHKLTDTEIEEDKERREKLLKDFDNKFEEKGYSVDLIDQSLDLFKNLTDAKDLSSDFEAQVFLGLLEEHLKISLDILPASKKEKSEKGKNESPLKGPVGFIWAFIQLIPQTVSSSEVARILLPFRYPDRGFIMPPKKRTEDNEDDLDLMCSLAHESLMQKWTKLREWVTDENKYSDEYDKILKSEIQAKEKESKDEKYLAGLALSSALEWRHEHTPTHVWARRHKEEKDSNEDSDKRLFDAKIFVADSEYQSLNRVANDKEEEVDKLKRSRRFALFGTLAAIIFLILAGVGVGLAGLARKAEKEADNQKNIAIFEAERAKSLRLRADSLKEQALIAKDTAEAQKLKAEEAKLIAEAAEIEAELRRKEAEAEKNRAREAEEKALIEQGKAETAKAKAEQERIRAENKALVANLLAAQRMATRSRDIDLEIILDGEKKEMREKKLLGAQQAFIINENYRIDNNGNEKGNEYDPNIYSALEQALKANVGKEYNQYKSTNPDAPIVKGGISSIAFSADPNKFYVTGKRGEIKAFKLGDLDDIGRSIDVDNRSNRTLALSNLNGKEYILVTKQLPGQLRLVQDGGKNIDFSLKDQKGRILDVVFVPKSLNLIVATDDGNIMYYDWGDSQNDVLEGPQINRKIDSLSPDFDEIRNLTIHPISNKLVASGKNGQVYVWDDTFTSSSEDINRVATTTNVKNDSTNHRIELIGTFSIRRNPINILCFSANGKWLVGGDELGQIRVWNGNDLRKDAKPEYALRGHEAGIVSLAFSTIATSDTTLKLASGSRDNTVRMWAFTPERLRRFGHEPIVMEDQDLESSVMAVTFSPDGKYLLAGYEEGQIKQWPTSLKQMADIACSKVDRNLKTEEWNDYTGRDAKDTDEDLAYRCTCIGDKPNMSKLAGECDENKSRDTMLDNER